MSKSAAQPIAARAPKSPEIVEKALKADQAATEKALRAGSETAEKALKTGSAAMTQAYDHAFGAAKEQVQKAFPQAATQFEELASFQRANLEALFAISATAMKGAETLTEHLLAFNKKAMEHGMATSQKLLDCKTMQDVMALQADCACAQLEQAIDHGSKFTDIAMHVAGEIAEPLQQRLGQAAEKLGKATTA